MRNQEYIDVEYEGYQFTICVDGTEVTIGSIEHLKNHSQLELDKYRNALFQLSTRMDGIRERRIYALSRM